MSTAQSQAMEDKVNNSKATLTLSIPMQSIGEDTNKSESIKEEKRGFFSLTLAGRKRTASEAFGDDKLSNE